MKRNPKALFALSPLMVAGVGAGVMAGPAAAATQPSPAASSISAASKAASKPVTHADNKRVPKGAAWTEHYFPSTDDVELHADVLLPANLKPGKKLPVILAVGPYFGHSGQMGPEGFKQTGPSARFNDLVTEGRALERGYALVMVDSRGFGGSSGCHDLFGPGEQADVKAAIDWASKQSWSNGSVGMYGKSYDASTTLIGSNSGHPALKAAIAKEPLWEPYRNFRSDGVPRTTIVQVSGTYSTIATQPQMPDDSKRYKTNAAWETKNPECALEIINGYQTADRNSAYWQARDLAGQAAGKGTNTPLFFTQGFTEWNTEAEGMREFLENHQGPERGWLGPWDHVRGNDRSADGKLKIGRSGWFTEVFAFYDEHLKGKKPSVSSPAFAVQDSTGKWRGQKSWPVSDGRARLDLGAGQYRDDAMEGKKDGSTFVVHSEPLTRETRLVGTPQLTLNAGADGNVQVKLYDVAADGKAVVINEQVSQIRDGKADFELRSIDWNLAEGHRLAVEIGTVQPGIPTFQDWIATPSGRTIEVTGAAVAVDLDDPSDDVATKGKPAQYLAQYREIYAADLSGRLTGDASFTVPLGGN